MPIRRGGLSLLPLLVLFLDVLVYVWLNVICGLGHTNVSAVSSNQ